MGHKSGDHLLEGGYAISFIRQEKGRQDIGGVTAALAANALNTDAITGGQSRTRIISPADQAVVPAS